MNKPFDFAVADLSLAAVGRTEIRLAEYEMPGLMALRRKYAPERPLEGIRIAGALALTIQTAVLIETLVALGVDVRWSGCNVLGTQNHAAAAVVVGPEGDEHSPKGVPVFAWRGQTVDDYWECMERALLWPDGTGPDTLMDDGADSTLLVHEGVRLEKEGNAPDPGAADDEHERAMRRLLARTYAERPQQWTEIVAGIKGVTEETTCGVVRLNRLADRGDLLFPALNINDAVTKSKYDNQYGCRHSLIDGINRGTDVMIGGKLAVVIGYGNVGKGCVQALKGQGARVVVVETDPICALQAAMDGFQVATLDDVVETGDIFVTATGACRVIRPEHMARMKHLAIVGNIGHDNVEVDVTGLAAYPGIRKSSIKPQVDEWVFPEGHSIVVLGDGYVLNFGNATGHPSFVMSASFSNQVLGQIELCLWLPEYPVGLHLLSRQTDEEVARLHLDALGVKLSTLTKEQADYLGVQVEGPFKSDTYRY